MMLIVGTGAMACLFAAQLAAAGRPVAMLGSWLEGLEALEQEGVRLVAEDGAERSYPVRVLRAGIDCSRVRFALVLVKAWQTGRASRQLAGCLGEDGLAVSLQNGLGNRQILAQRLGEDRVVQGVTTAGATLLGPGRVRAAGSGQIFLPEHPGLAPLISILSSAGFQVETSARPEELLWGKLVINAAINPLTALLECPNGALPDCGSASQLMAELAREAAGVAAAQDIHLPYSDPAEAAESVARQTAANHSSMLQDIRRGAPTEIDAICGEIVRAGKRLGIATPVNETLWRLVKAKVGLKNTRQS